MRVLSGFFHLQQEKPDSKWPKQKDELAQVTGPLSHCLSSVSLLLLGFPPLLRVLLASSPVDMFAQLVIQEETELSSQCPL